MTFSYPTDANCRAEASLAPQTSMLEGSIAHRERGEIGFPL
jgi:hypothetical protein